MGGIFFIYTRFPNTHEPLVDEETFALAQKRIATRHRPTKSEEIDLFSGLLFCGDCGYKMYLQKGAGTPERKHAYTCGNYRNRARNDFLCTTHYIRKTVLKELVLADLQRVLSYVKEHEQEFIRTAAECGADVKRFVAIVRRYSEISELTYENVHEFFDRILVHELDRETNTRKIEIFYSFVGKVDSGEEPTESISYFRQIGADVKSFAV